MDKPNRRLARLNEQLRREVTEILRRTVRDPRVAGVVVSAVEVTSDLWLARVYVHLEGEEQERAEALRGLDAAANFIRRELAGVLHIRRIPELRFLEDKTLAHANRIEEILKGLEEVGEEGDAPGAEAHDRDAEAQDHDTDDSAGLEDGPRPEEMDDG